MDQLNFPEDAQLELRSVNLENTQLRKQIHDIHHQLVEKTGDLEKQIKSLEKYSEPAQVILYFKSFCVNSIGISLVGSSVVQMWEALDLHWCLYNKYIYTNNLCFFISWNSTWLPILCYHCNNNNSNNNNNNNNNNNIIIIIIILTIITSSSCK